MNAKRSVRPLPWVGFSLLAGLAIAAQFIAPPIYPIEEWSFLGALGSMGLVGALILSLQPGNRIGRIFFALGATGMAGAFVESYAEAALLGTSPLPGGVAVALMADVQFPLILVLMVFLLVWFPTGSPPTPRWRWLPRISVTNGVLGLGHFFLPGRLEFGAVESLPIDNPLGVEALAPYFETYSNIWFLVALSAMLGAAVSLVIRFRRSTGTERQQLKWFAYAVAIFAVDLGVDGILLDGIVGMDSGPAGKALAGITLLLIPAAAGVAILRYRLFDIDVIINKTLVYGVLTAFLGMCYFGAVVLLQTITRPITAGSDLAIAGSTLAVAAMFRPARRGIQAFVDRRFYRRRYDAAKTLEDFSARLRREIDLDSLAEELGGAVRTTVQPVHVSMWLAS